MYSYSELLRKLGDMDKMQDLVWVTPDPQRVKRFIALRRNGRWTETYIGERLLVHSSHLWELTKKGFMKTDGNVSAYVFATPEEAENCDDNLRMKVK